VLQLRAWLAKPEARWLIAIFVLALVVRLGYVAYVHPNPRDGRYDDSLWYDTAARHIAAGDGYVFDPNVWKTATGDLIYPTEHDLTPTALWPPGYPITLGAVYKLTGDSLVAGRLLNVLFGALTAALVFLIGRKLFDLTAAVFAGGALALLPAHVMFTGLLLSETYYGFLVALVLTLFVYFVFARQHANLPLTVGLGALTAFTGYVRGEFMAFGAVLALLMILHYRRNALIPVAAFAVGAAIVVTPWVIRNEIQFGEPIAGTTGAGRVAYQGHNPIADGQPSLTAALETEAPFAGLPRDEIEIRSNKAASRAAREWAMAHKLEELKLIPQRMYFLFRNDEAGVTWTQSNKPWFGQEGADRLTRFSTFTFFGLIALALAGAPLWWRTKDLARWAVFAIAPFYIVMFGVLFIGDPRYHYALYLPICVFASVGLAAIWRMTREQWREVSGGRSLGAVLRTFGTPAP
jgi:4-amino-4-deoxy-L-arabinose transferase-like glycosyltransferase